MVNSDGSMRKNSFQTEIDLPKMCGTWYIVRTTLAFWRHRSNPNITYRLIEQGKQTKILDIVRYGALAHPQKEIVGIDTQDATIPNLFHWRGSKWYTRLLTSNWYVLDHDEDYQEWAITYFSPTWLTTSGIDIYARSPAIPPEKVAEIVAKITEYDFLKRYVGSLFSPIHE